MSKKRRTNNPNLADGYTGDLATPIEPAGVFGSPDESEDEVKRRLVEQLALKSNKLFEWYGIDPNGPDAWMNLALKLAVAHVPGMQIRHEPRKRGRKRTWKDGLGSELIRDVAALQQTKKLNHKQAIAELQKDKKKPWRVYTTANLITRHREARKSGRRLTEQLLASPLWKLGAMFGKGRTDENSSDQN
jgi:hypothetical protein